MGGTQSAEHPVVQLFLTNTLNETTLRKALTTPANPPTTIDGTGRKGDSVLSLAAQCGALNIVSLVLNNGANIIQTSSPLLYKRTPYHIAIVEKQEHVAVMLWMRSEFVRAIPYTEDATKWFPLQHAARHRLYYLLWLTCIGIHAMTAFPLRVLNDLRTWNDLSYSKYSAFMRRAYQHAQMDPISLSAVKFASFGLPASVYISGDKGNYDYQAKNTQNFHGLWQYSLKHLNPVNINQPPILSAPTHGRCTNCSAEQCQSNECVLLCYMGHIHQFSQFLRNGVMSQLQPEQSVDPNRRAAIITELAKFAKMVNQSTPEKNAQIYKYHNSNATNELLPNLLLPPPILLSTAIHDQYLCTRTRCVCAQSNPSQPQCFVYPPLLSIPTVPLNYLTLGGFHNSFCNTIPLDQQQKHSTVTNINPTILKSKSNVHSHDIIQLHLDYIRCIHRIYQIPQPVYSTSDLCPQVDSPGFSVPIDYRLSRYIDGTTKAVQSRPKGLGEKATGFFGAIMDMATSALSQEPKFQDGSKPTNLDQVESVILNNIRTHANRLSLDTKFTSIVVGEKRDHITPLRMTEESPNDVFSSFYPQGAPQVLAYEHTSPILDQTFTTTQKLQNRTKTTLPQVTTAVQNYQRQRQVPPTIYPPIPDLLSRKMADLTQPLAPISTKDPYQYSHSQTCLCGAHNTNIQPVPLTQTSVSLNVDGKSLRITDRTESETYQKDANNDNPFASVLYSSLTPHTSIIYRPQQDGLAEAIKTFDYGLPYFQRQFEDLVPPLNPTNDISTASNNFNAHHANGTPGSHVGTAVCAQGSYPSVRASTMLEQKVGDIIISPTQHITIVIPFSSSPQASLYFVSNLHRVMCAKYPHYALMSQWNLFTTRIAGAIQRLAQRRMTQRLITSEVNLLNIFLQDTRFIHSTYRQHFGDHLNNPAAPGSLSIAMPYFLKQAEMTDNYINLLEKYILLRRYRLGTCQFTPGSNLLALFGNVQCDDEHDSVLYRIANPGAATSGTFSAPHVGSSYVNVQNMTQITIRERLTSTHVEGAKILTNVPTPLPPGFAPNQTVTQAPPNTSTLKSFTEASTTAINNFQPYYIQQIKAFQTAYPKLALNPNTSIIQELDQYFTALKLWENRNAGGVQKQIQQPLALQQPFSMADNFMLDTFLSVIPNIIRGYIQQIQNTIGQLQFNMGNPQHVNIHRVNFGESIQILESLRRQAIQLDQWLCLPEISPHFHTKTHVFPIRDQTQNVNGLQFQNIPDILHVAPGQQQRQALVVDPQAQFSISTNNPTPTPRDLAASTAYPPTPSMTQSTQSSNSQQYQTSTSYPQQPSPQTNRPQQQQTPTNQAVMTMQLGPPPGQQQQQQQHQPQQAVMTMQLGPPPGQQNNNFYPQQQQQQQGNLYPTLPARPNRASIAPGPQPPQPVLEEDMLPPPSYDLDGSQAAPAYDPNYGAPPEYGTTGGYVSDEYVTAPTFTYFDDRHAQEREAERQRREAEEAQRNQRNNAPLSNSLGGLFQDDEHESAPNYDLNDLPDAPMLNRTDSEMEREYFYDMVVAEPSIVLALDDDYIAKIERNPKLLHFLKDKQPQIWTQLTNYHPHLIKAVKAVTQPRTVFM